MKKGHTTQNKEHPSGSLRLSVSPSLRNSKIVKSKNWVNSVNLSFHSMLIVFCFIFIALISLFFTLPLEAKVTGYCSNCHTMHGSQTPPPTVWTDKGWTAGTTRPALLVASCVGCHSSTGSETTLDNGTTPIVFNMSPPLSPLAGGNFYDIMPDNVDGHANGHNVAGIDDKDFTLNTAPPGGTDSGEQLTCSGTYGCHGDRDIADDYSAVKGSHHTSDSTIDGSTVGKSYRFLNGILGKEDTDWEKDNDYTSHNEYQGATAFNDETTISHLCAECHDNYHSTGGVGNGGPWLRHPTDVALKSSGEYSSYTVYSMVAPVARTNPNSVIAEKVYPGFDIIMCLSCHRAHASPHFKMMRWDYKSWPGSGTNGCNVCHTSKN